MSKPDTMTDEAYKQLLTNFRGSPKTYTLTAANELANMLNSGDEDGWQYKVTQCPASYSRYVVEAYDSNSQFVEYASF